MTSHNPKESFIPISRFALIDCLTHQDGKLSDEQYHEFLLALGSLRHLHYRKKLQQFKELYLPFSPDRDTLQVLEYDTKQLDDMKSELINELSTLLTKANYSQVTTDDLDHIFATQSVYGLQLKVDLSEFEDILLFSRGSSVLKKQQRTPSSFFLRKKTIETPIFQRLFLLLKLKAEVVRIQEIMQQEAIDKDKAQKLLQKYRRMLPERISNQSIYLKVFKEIPQIDLEMLFPNTQVKLKPFDKLKLGVTAGGGTAGSIFATISKLAVAANPMTIVTVILGLAAVLFRQVTKFFTQRTKYMMVLAQKLYFHNLANNRGVLTLMTDRAEEEDIKESFLLYHFLYQYDFSKNNLPEQRAKIKDEIEAFIKKQCGISIDFDLENAISTLASEGILVEQEQALHVLPPNEALPRIKALWDQSLVCSLDS